MTAWPILPLDALPGPAMQRARGRMRAGFRVRDGRTALATLRQDGCLKARLPRAFGPEAEIVLVNSSGGVAPGDELDLSLALAAGARVSFASQAAERLYRALPESPPARLRAAIALDAGASLAWLPQETILFDGARMDRALAVDMAADASFLGIEWIVLGRAAMGERVRTGALSDALTLRRDGRLVLHDIFRAEGALDEILARPALLGGARGIATLVLAAPDAPSRLEALRTALEGAEAGVSARDGLLLARILAPDGAALRRAAIAGLQAPRGAGTLPRVWSL